MTGGDLGWVSLGVSFLLGLGMFWNARRGNRNTEKKLTVEEEQARFGANLELNRYIDGRVKELVEERLRPIQEALESLKVQERTRTAAMTRILRAIAGQWPVGFPGPILDPADIAAVEETIPAQWLTRPPRAPG